jgi:Uma2 family endonuclease
MTVMVEPQRQLSEEELLEVARLLNLNLEVTKEGIIRLVTPAHGKTSRANAAITAQLTVWAEAHGGYVYDSNTWFVLPDGSRFGPDAAYITPERIASVPADAFKRFPEVCPNFVIELMSDSDSVAETTEKMQNWIENGVELGWMIDPYRRLGYLHAVYVFSPDSSHFGEPHKDVDVIHGYGPVAGFELDLAKVWKCYE